jgi:thymidylate synthase
MVLQVAHPSDVTLVDPPCLRSIDTRIQDDTLHFCIYFRSWDLWSGLPANLAGIQNLKEYMASEIGVKDGEMIVESKGLHLYGYAEDLAKLRCLKA